MKSGNNYWNESLPQIPLGTEDEQGLIYEYKNSWDIESRNYLVEHNLRWFIGEAKKVASQRPPHYLEGLLDEAVDLALFTAERFEDWGIRFISYSAEFVKDSLSSFRPGVDAQGRECHHFKDHSNHRPGRYLDATVNSMNKGILIVDDDVLKLCSSRDNPAKYRSRYTKERIVPIRLGLVSLWRDSLANEEGKNFREGLEEVEDVAQSAPDRVYEMNQLSIYVERALKQRLDGREYKIIESYFGLNDNDTLTLDRIGLQIGLTRERVRQIKERALTKLRSSPQCLEILLNYHAEAI